MTLVRWNPAHELASMEIDRLNGMMAAMVPAVDIFETPQHEFVIKAELPEMKREEIAVTFDDQVLTFKGERRRAFAEAEGTLHRRERASGSFSRSFTLPATVDGNRITASYRDGVLTIRVPQREDARAKTIDVQE